MKYSTDEEFIRVWRELKSAAKVSEFFNMDLRAVYKRRKNLEIKRLVKN